MTRQEFDEAYDNGYQHGYAAGRSDSDILDKIKVEIEQMPSELTIDGRRMIRRVSVFRIIDKYKGVEE